VSRLDDILNARPVGTRGQNTLAVGSGLRRMGEKGGTLPIVEETTWPQVIVMGQLNHLTSEPFEARGLVSGLVFPSAGDFSGFEVFSRGGGGLVIEDFMGTVSAGGALMRIRISDTAAMPIAEPGVNAVVPIDVGGFPVRSTVVHGDLDIMPSDGLQMALDASSGILQRLFVPAGSYFSFISQEANKNLRWSILFRELEDVQGAP